MSKFYFGTVDEDSPKPIYAQAIAPVIASTLITQSVCSSIAYTVDQYDSRDDAVNASDPTAITASTSLTVSSVVFDTLQTTGDGGALVTDKGTGYNFATVIPAASFPTQGKWYRVDVRVTPTAGDTYTLGKWVLECSGRNG